VLRFGNGHVREREVGSAASVSFYAEYRGDRGWYFNRSVRELGVALGLCAFGRRGIAA